MWCCLQPVCTTEIGRLALKYKELSSKGVKIATLSADPVRHCTFCPIYAGCPAHTRVQTQALAISACPAATGRV